MLTRFSFWSKYFALSRIFRLHRHRCAFFSITFLLLTGCNIAMDANTSAATDKPDHLSLLGWAESANPERDAKAAIAKKDYRLLVLAGRGSNMPGVKATEQAALQKRCGIQYLKGSTDVVRSDKHSVLLEKAYNYAEKYNILIAAQC